MKREAPKESITAIDNVLYFVRQSMYDYVNISKSEMSGEEEDNNDEINDDNNNSGSGKDDTSNSDVEAPDTYIFPGYMVFVAQGTFAEPN